MALVNRSSWVIEQSSLSGRFVSYEENGVLWIRYQRAVFTTLHFFWMSTICYSICPWLVFPHSSLLGKFLSYKENEMLRIHLLQLTLNFSRFSVSLKQAVLLCRSSSYERRNLYWMCPWQNFEWKGEACREVFSV